MKYIISLSNTGLETPSIFPDYILHSNMAGEKKVVAAGKCWLNAVNDKVRVTCFGESVSLKVKSRGKEDAYLIENMIEFEGI